MHKGFEILRLKFDENSIVLVLMHVGWPTDPKYLSFICSFEQQQQKKCLRSNTTNGQTIRYKFHASAMMLVCSVLVLCNVNERRHFVLIELQRVGSLHA